MTSYCYLFIPNLSAVINIELDRAIEFKKQTVVTTIQRTNICDTDINDCLCIYQITVTNRFELVSSSECY